MLIASLIRRSASAEARYGRAAFDLPYLGARAAQPYYYDDDCGG
jgi:hypothetical protein